MLWTAHSHSGQFCTHAVSSLEEVILAAIAKSMTHISLTEHIPRCDEDLYPGELTVPVLANHTLWTLFDAYYAEATRLRGIYSSQIQILIGFEAEWIRPDTLRIIRELQAKYTFDTFIGSVHHVLTHPIDFDDETLALARNAAGGTDVALAEAYYDSQLEMLEALKPPVVGHFDLIRLKLGPEFQDRDWRQWDGAVWEKILRNLAVVKAYGGILEVNSAALRKGLKDVYPRREIMEEWTRMGGRLTLSDDSHGVEQLCTNYKGALQKIRDAGVEELWYFSPTEELGTTTLHKVMIDEVDARLG